MSFTFHSFRLRNAALGAVLALAAALAPDATRAEEVLPGPVPATLLRVIDGDTLLVRARVWLDLEVVARVRLRGVNAPELRAQDGEERARAAAARAFVAGLAEGASLTLTEIGKDKYGGRVVARVAVDGADLGSALLASGHARPIGARCRRSPG